MNHVNISDLVVHQSLIQKIDNLQQLLNNQRTEVQNISGSIQLLKEQVMSQLYEQMHKQNKSLLLESFDCNEQNLKFQTGSKNKQEKNEELMDQQKIEYQTDIKSLKSSMKHLKLIITLKNQIIDKEGQLSDVIQDLQNQKTKLQNQIDVQLTDIKQFQNEQIELKNTINSKGQEQYCYAKIFEEGPFEKVNGGTFQLNIQELHQFLNAFSLFSYHLMNKQQIVTNLQIVGNYLHDMIVSTKYQIFTSIDQGQNYIDQAIIILEKAPQNAFSRYWNKSIEIQAQQGWI